MGRSFTIAAQSLASSFILMLGLSVYGCSDSGSVNPVVELASLRVMSGTDDIPLQPSFNSATTNYTVADLSRSLSGVTITAQPAVAGDSVTINREATTSRAIPLGGAGTTTPVNIVVSESGTNSRTYTVLLTKADLTGNNSLRSLSISPGSLNPSFNTNNPNYEVSVASTVNSMRVTPTLDDPAATMTVNGQPTTSGQAKTIPLRDPGLTTILTITVTAQNSTPKTYTVVVARAALGGNNNLQSLTVSPSRLDPAFSTSRTSYTVSVGGRVDSLTVTAAPDDTTARMTINEQGTSSRSIPLPDGPSSTEIQVIVTAPNGIPKTYFITVNRAALSADNNLEALSVSPGTLDPPFSAGTTQYTVEVATGVTNVGVTATKSDPNAVISGDIPNGGQANIPLDGPGTSKNVSIIVTAPNGTSKTYGITVNRLAPSTDSNLANLTVSAGTLNPGFSSGTLSYTVTVPASVDSLTVIATKSDVNSVMSSPGSVIAPAGVSTGSVSSSLGLGTTTPFTITVIAQDGVSTRPYTINAFRESR
ncbi:MAG: cadherin-like beta sandwich domain-containing protein [Nitrospira sp.]|nr:cadherin-like beta sandwich domain-containing protein [Nitrospira sp.]